PLIALGRADALEPLEHLPVEFVAPMEVCRELEQGEVAGHKPAALHSPAIRFVELTGGLSPLAAVNPGMGEAAVIQLALNESFGVVCIDERKRRRAALAVGLRVTGTLGVLGRLKTTGVVGAVQPFVERLRGGRDRRARC
ncbi:hypothetical protein ACFL5O_12170, partial [Myxococcota bacterium]